MEASRRATASPGASISRHTVAWFAFQTVELVRERTSLQTARASQEVTLAQAEKLRAQLDSIAKKTRELAQQAMPEPS